GGRWPLRSMNARARALWILLASAAAAGPAAGAEPAPPVAPAPPAAPAPPKTASGSTVPGPSAVPPALPHLKVSYRRFAIANLDLTHVPLQGVEIDAYPVSTQWGRGGFEVEGGVGHAALNGVGVDARYGLIGFSAAFQYAAPVTPFVEGRLVGGIL